MYILTIRIGKEYLPVSYPDGHVCWPGGPHRPTIFDSKSRLEAEIELKEYLDCADYKFITKEPGEIVPLNPDYFGG